MKKFSGLIGMLLWMFLLVTVLFGPGMAAAQTMNVTLAWDPNKESDLAGYRIYWSLTSGTYTATTRAEIPLASLADRTHPQFTVTGLDNTKKFYFVATAYDTEGKESAYSNEVSYIWDGVFGIPPAPPSGLKPLEILIKRADGTEVRIIIP